MLSVGFFGGSVRPSSPGMPRPHRSPPGSLLGKQPRTPNAHPGTPNVPHSATRCSRGPLHSNFAPQTPQRLQAAGLAAQMLRQEPLGAQTQPTETPNTPPRTPQSPLRTPQTHPGTQRTPGMPNAISRDPPGHPNTPRSPPPLQTPPPHPHRPRLAVVGVAVRDDFGQLHDPVVDFIPPAPLHCEGKEGGTREGGGGASPLKAQSHPHSRPPFSRDYSSHDAPGDAALPACTAALLNCVSQHALQRRLYLAARLGGCPIDA